MTVFVPISAFANNPTVVKETKNSVSPPLRDVVVRGQSGKSQQGQVAQPTGAPLTNSQPDPAAHVLSNTALPVIAGLNFDGIGATDTVASGGPFVPPDTNGAVGATQFVQWVNITFEVFDKKTGLPVMGPTPGNAFWAGFGGPCETRNDGDIIIQYDKMADRWVAAQPVFVAPFMYCLAVSTSSDATGTYNQYAFPLGNFPDYPKLSVWPDAYYATFNMFTQQFLGAQACAYDRTNMLAGNPATLICKLPWNRAINLLPSDLDGATPPPAGSKNYYLGIHDTSHLQEF